MLRQGGTNCPRPARPGFPGSFCLERPLRFEFARAFARANGAWGAFEADGFYDTDCR